MKKILFIFSVLIITVNLFGQSNNISTTVYTSFYRNTLTASVDTADIKFQSGFDYYTLTVYTASGNDTLQVYTKGEGDYGNWAQKSLVDLSSNAIISQIVTSSTYKEYLIQDPGTVWIRLITPDNTATIVFTINAKKGNYAVNGSAPLTLPLPTGSSTATNQLTNITRLDTVNARISRIDTKLSNGTQRSIPVNGANAIIGVATSPFYTTPDYARVFVKDSLVNKDTVAHNFNFVYLKVYLGINNRSGTTPDSLAAEYYSNLKNAWTSYAIGFVDVLTNILETNNSLIIIPAATEKRFEINFLRPGQVRIRSLSTRARTSDVSFMGVN